MSKKDETERGVARAIAAVDEVLRASEADEHVSQELRNDLALAALSGWVGMDARPLAIVAELRKDRT